MAQTTERKTSGDINKLYLCFVMDPKTTSFIGEVRVSSSIFRYICTSSSFHIREQSYMHSFMICAEFDTHVFQCHDGAGGKARGGGGKSSSVVHLANFQSP